jgi:hypothetical protein
MACSPNFHPGLGFDEYNARVSASIRLLKPTWPYNVRPADARAGFDEANAPPSFFPFPFHRASRRAVSALADVGRPEEFFPAPSSNRTVPGQK